MTDHGLGHASRTVAIIRELEKKNVNVIIRSNDPFEFLKKSLHEVKIIKGQTFSINQKQEKIFSCGLKKCLLSYKKSPQLYKK